MREKDGDCLYCWSILLEIVGVVFRFFLCYNKNLKTAVTVTKETANVRVCVPSSNRSGIFLWESFYQIQIRTTLAARLGLFRNQS